MSIPQGHRPPHQPVVPPPVDPASIPNTGPDKVPGVFAVNDLVLIRGRWSRDYIVRGPGDDEAFVRVIADCGCGGVVQVAKTELVHIWHYRHPEPGA